MICGFSYDKIKQKQKSGGGRGKNKSANPLPLLWFFPIPLNICMLCSVGHKIPREFLKTLYNIWTKYALYLQIYNDSLKFFTDYFSPINPLEILNICSVLWFCLLVCFLENISWFLGWIMSHQPPSKTIFFFFYLGASIFFWTNFLRVQFPHMFYLSTLVSCNHSFLCPCLDILAKHKVILWAGHAQKFKNHFFGYHTHMITTRLGINVFITLYKTYAESLLARQAKISKEKGSSYSSLEHSHSLMSPSATVFFLMILYLLMSVLSLVCNFSFLISYESPLQTFSQVLFFLLQPSTFLGIPSHGCVPPAMDLVSSGTGTYTDF